MGKKKPPSNLQLVHRGGALRDVIFVEWLHPKESKMKAQAYVDLGNQAGKVAVSVSHGWCAKPCHDWRLTDESQKALLDYAFDSEKREIRTVPRSPGRKRQPKTPKAPDPRQLRLIP